MLDVVIKGGDLIDGTGSPRRRADVGIADGRSPRSAPSTPKPPSTIDATGKVVTPGFVDVHTHYDAQVFWDGALTPSPLARRHHGAGRELRLHHRTAVRQPRRRRVPHADARPGRRHAARRRCDEGVPWNWTSTAEYFDEIDGRLGINVGFMVGHSAIRRVVMGTECCAAAAATPTRSPRCRRCSARASQPGGSASRRRGRAPTTTPTGDTVAVALRHPRRARRARARRAGGVRGHVTRVHPAVSGAFEPWAAKLMADMSCAAQRAAQLEHHARRCRQSRQGATASSRWATTRAPKGGKVVALPIPMPFALRLSFRAGSCSMRSRVGKADGAARSTRRLRSSAIRKRARLNELAGRATPSLRCSLVGRRTSSTSRHLGEREVRGPPRRRHRGGRGRSRSTCSTGSRSPTTCTPGSVPSRLETHADWKAPGGRSGGRAGGDRRIRRRRAPRHRRVVPLRHRALDHGVHERGAHHRGSGAPHHGGPGELYGLRDRGRVEGARTPTSSSSIPTLWPATPSRCGWTSPEAQAGCTRARRACSTCW